MMKPMKSRVVFFVLLIAVTGVFFARFHISLVRFFDPDEFAHLHWAWLVSQGKLPYRDFFFYATPVFQWFLFPLFTLPPSDRILLLARLWELFLYLVSLFFIFRITKRITKNDTTSLLSALIFATFPMTLDKTIDIRPDFFMLLPYLMAIERILAWKTIDKARCILIGILLGTSMVIFQKAIPMIPSALILFILQIQGINRNPDRYHKIYLYIFVLLGILVPTGLFLLYLVTNNLHVLAWDTFTHTQFVVNTGKQTFSLLATLSPWPLVYVTKGGVSIPWLVNMGVWLFAIGGIIILWKQHRSFAVFSACFALSAILFLVFFPAPYVQYFIPLSAVASILAAAGIWYLVSSIWVTTKIHSQILNTVSQILIVCILLLSFYLQYRERILPASNNEEQLGVIRDVLLVSKPTDTFYDMVGSYVFRPDGYFICCHPYAEFVDNLTVKPPSLRASLITNKTRFVVFDRTGQSLWKPKQEDLDYIKANYFPSKNPKIYILK